MLYDGLGSVGAFGSMLAGAVRASMLKVGRSGQDFNVAAAPGMETFFVVRTKWGVPLERGGRRTPPRLEHGHRCTPHRLEHPECCPPPLTWDFSVSWNVACLT